MRESELLSHIYTRSADIAARYPHVAVGPGDDCAVVRAPGGGALLLVTVDQLVEGRHYRADATPVDLIARKVVARSVSDIAAMAGSPSWALATGALPRDFPDPRALCDALHRWAEHWSCPMIGGDIASTDGPAVLTVTVAGVLHPDRGPVLRSTARPGDLLWVTGRLGGSLQPDGAGRHLTFEPRLDEARWLCDTLGDRLHAMIDLSDGLGIDAGRIAAASGVAIEIDADAVPLAEGVTDPRRAIADGEDYELCFTTPACARLPDACPATGTQLTQIGRVTQGRGCSLRHADCRTEDASRAGWDHAD